MEISKIDKNFSNHYSFEGMVTYDINDAPFKLYGLCRETGELDFKRLPHSLVQQTDNNSIRNLYKNTAGIRVKFKTDSQRIVLKCVLPRVFSTATMPLTGSSCFDLYADGEYCSVFRPGIDVNGNYGANPMKEDGYASGYVFKEKKLREILIHFPSYNDVNEVYIALEEGCRIMATDEYKMTCPIIFYGSSITQGGCASHSGNSYSAIISRRLDCDYINLGFSSGCFAEIEMCEYIAKLNKSILVYDYDHNAPDVQFLEKTHEQFFIKMRESNPKLPIIIISAADISFGAVERKRRKSIIEKTYRNAVKAGDDNVYFIDGSKIYEEPGVSYCTVDGLHPNDMGFFCMANAVEDVISFVFDKASSR